ncbi:MAG: hypothetical protein MUC33_20105 [Desulfobacterales bacterium]|nr:hypothetical protein [Desulfobacterales bacterium]
MRRRCGWVIVAAVMVGLCGTGMLWAQEIKGPIKIVVPYPAGGGSDVVARLIADKLKDSLGQAVAASARNTSRASRRTGPPCCS